eukprot:3695793-Heterocapsa_arctica.AAC.1
MPSDGCHQAQNGIALPLALCWVAYAVLQNAIHGLADHRCHGAPQVSFENGPWCALLVRDQ